MTPAQPRRVYLERGNRDLGAALALASEATELLGAETGDDPPRPDALLACAHILTRAGNHADHAALMFRMAEEALEDGLPSRWPAQADVGEAQENLGPSETARDYQVELKEAVEKDKAEC